MNTKCNLMIIIVAFVKHFGRQASNQFLPVYLNVQVITLYQVLMNMSGNYMTLLEVHISFGDSLVNHVLMSQRLRTSRLRYKYALRQCQNNDEIIRADALAWSLYCKDSVSFWKGVRGMNCNNIPLTTKVGDAVGSKNITQLWQDHFSTLLNSVPNIDSKEFVCENIEHGVSDVSMAVVSASDVLDSLKLSSVKLGKAAGIDGLSAEHFVCAHTSVSVHLSLLLTSMLSHGHMPAGLMKTAIVPILTRCTRGVRVVFSVTGMRSSNSARINKFVFRTEKIV